MKKIISLLLVILLEMNVLSVYADGAEPMSEIMTQEDVFGGRVTFYKSNVEFDTNNFNSETRYIEYADFATEDDYILTMNMKQKEVQEYEYGYIQISVGSDYVRFFPQNGTINYLSNPDYNWTQHDRQYSYAWANDTETLYNLYFSRIGNEFTFAIKKFEEESYLGFTVISSEANTAPFRLNSFCHGAIITDIKGYFPSEPCFYDDFEAGLGNWKVKDYSMQWNDGFLESVYTDGNLNRSEIDGNSKYMYEDISMMIRFKLGSENGWAGIQIYNESGRITELLLRKGGITHLESSESHVCSYNFKTDMLYDLCFAVKENEYKVYIKPVDSKSYTLCGMWDRINQDKFNVAFTTDGYMQLAVDCVSIYEYTNSDLYFIQKPMTVWAGESIKFEAAYNGTEALSYIVQDEGTAVIGSDGRLYGVEAGYTELQVTDGTLTVTVPVKVIRNAEEISLSTSKLALKTGEAVNIELSISPGDAAPRETVWSSSDETVVSLRGNSNTARTICANTEGTAVITVKTLNGISAEATVAVYDSYESAGTENNLFRVGESHVIPDTLNGMHKVSNSYSEQLYDAYNSLFVGSVRSPYGTDRTLDEVVYPYKEMNYPLVVCLEDFAAAGIDELIDQVDALVAATGNTAPYIEMGNEVNAIGISVEEYAEKCKSFYTCVKHKYPDAKIGIVEVGDDLWLQGVTDWGNVISLYSQYFDAVILHNYVTFNNMKHYTSSTMMSSIYQYNELLKNSIYRIASKYPDKEIWVTEYGHLDLVAFNTGNLSERNRFSIGKTVGVGISNAILLLDMAESNKVSFANYHTLFDSQGFGLIQDNVKLPGYYLFEQIGRIMKENNYFWRLDPVDVKRHNGSYNIAGIRTLSEGSFDETDSWGFGNKDKINKIIIVNKTSKEQTYTLKDYKLKRLWEYGSENPLDSFLHGIESYMSIPNNIPVPVEYINENYVYEISLPPYTMVICDAEKTGEFLTVSANIAEGEKNVPVDSVIETEFSMPVALYSADFSLTYGEEPVNILVEEKSGKYLITPEKLLYNTEYTLKINVSNNGKSEYTLNFKTTELEPWDYFENDERVYFIAAQGWELLEGQSVIKGRSDSQYITSAKDYDDFVLTFKAKKSGSGTLAVNVRDVVLEFSDNVVWCNGDSIGSNVFSHTAFTAEEGINVKLVAYGTSVTVFVKNESDYRYIKIGEILTADTEKAPVEFKVSGCEISVSDIFVKSNKLVRVEYSQSISDKKIPLWRVLKGKTKMEINVDNTIDHKIFLATYADGEMISAEASMNAALASGIMDSGSQYLQKLLIWTEDCKPLYSAVKNKR